MNHTLEEIKEELAKIQALGRFRIEASEQQFQVWDKQVPYGSMQGLIIDADFADSFWENLEQGLFGFGTLSDYLTTYKEKHP